MNILFIHQNFPAQFKHLSVALVKAGHQVSALTMRSFEGNEWNGVSIKSYSVNRSSTSNIHKLAVDFESKVIRAEACYKAAKKMSESGYSPNIIITHPGWGESLFIKDVWPKAKLGIYCEFFYQAIGADVNFDPEFSNEDIVQAGSIQLKNISNLLHLELADSGISPTNWQASTFPFRFRDKITVVHDGIDTQLLAPNVNIKLSLKTPLGKSITLSKKDEVVTFVNRNLEPYRGYHIFMRSLPKILQERPKVQIIIVGGDDVSYGFRPLNGLKWKEILIKEVRPQLSNDDWERVHFLGNIPYKLYIGILQLSSVHVYLTYPFVLSWSLLEAMSVGCSIVASDTKPLHEVITHNETGRLVSFFESNAVASEVCNLLDDPYEREKLGAKARAFAIDNYDLNSVCLPRQMQWVMRLAEQSNSNDY